MHQIGANAAFPCGTAVGGPRLQCLRAVHDHRASTIDMNSGTSPFDRLAALAARIDEVIAHSPAADLERNLKAQLVSELALRGLVTRDELERQVALLNSTRAQLEALQARVAELEAALRNPGTG
jgi:hypothetical protein